MLGVALHLRGIRIPEIQRDYISFCSLRRLFAVLMMPTSTTQEKQEKIRDMKALGRWYANALSPNEGLAGTLKPDYVGYHHNSYYASAYTPHALHKAALIQYLLSGTEFALGENHLSSKGTETLQVPALPRIRFSEQSQFLVPSFFRASR